jgi:hypothetical protein
MADKKNAQQELLKVLLALQNASEENMELLINFLNPSLKSAYKDNANLSNLAKSKQVVAIQQEMLIGKGKNDPGMLAKVSAQLNKTLQELNRINQQRKQLLAGFDSVKLKESLVTGKTLPKEQALKYNKAVNTILKKVNTMSMQLGDTLGVEVNMLHGVKFNDQSASRLNKIGSGVSGLVGQILKANDKLKQLQKAGPAQASTQQNEDDAPKATHKTPTPKPRGFK